MVMIRPNGKAKKIAESVLRQRGVKIKLPQKPQKLEKLGAYMMH